MKKHFVMLFAGLLLIGATGVVSAQEAMAKLSYSNEKIWKNYSADLLPADESSAISEKALRHFRDVFVDTVGSRWYATKDGFIGKIKRDGITIRMGYNKGGNWEYSIRYYSENKLPFEIRDIVKREYYDSSIDLVEEIEIKKYGLYYLVHTNDKQSLRNLLVHDGQLEVMKEMKK